jgi:uncharacterized membrane protein YvbJ
MKSQYCPECGKENPADARFCMACGLALDSGTSRRAASGSMAETGPAPVASARAGESGTDWAGIAAAVLALLSLRRLSRKGRQTAVVITFLVLFFGCPMVCGFAMFLVESFSRLFQ